MLFTPCPDRLPNVILTVDRENAIGQEVTRKMRSRGPGHGVTDISVWHHKLSMPCPYINVIITLPGPKKCDRNITVGAQHQQMLGKNENVIYAVPRSPAQCYINCGLRKCDRVWSKPVGARPPRPNPKGPGY